MVINILFILVNETKFGGELNTLSAVNTFLSEKYINNPIKNSKLIENKSVYVVDDKFIKDKYSFKIGAHKEFIIKFSNGKTCSIYMKSSDEKFFIYLPNEILFFQNKHNCLRYLINHM